MQANRHEPANGDHSPRHDHLLEQILARRPDSLLVIGCARNRLLQACRRLGVPAAGVDRDPAIVLQLQKWNLAVRHADGALPFADRSYDLVALANIGGGDTGTMLREAMRCSRRALLLATDWYDPALPCQAQAARIDHWLRQQRRRRGETVTGPLTSDQVVRELPELRRGDVDCQYQLRWQDRPRAALAAQITQAIADLPPTAVERREAAELLAETDRIGASEPGTMVLIARRAALAAATA